MRKIFAIGFKDLQLIFRDRAALIFMLLTPFIVTLGLGFVSGAFAAGDDNPGISDIPVMLINYDEGELGEQLTLLFESDDLDPLIDLVSPDTVSGAEAAARALVDEDELAALVIVPTGFTASMIPDQTTGDTQDGPPIELYRSPGRPISISVIEAIVQQFVTQVDSNTALVTTTIDQLLASGIVDATEINAAIDGIFPEGGENGQVGSLNLIEVATRTGSALEEEGDAGQFNILSVLAPGMALFFLMFTVTLGGRSILQERQAGTLGRIQTTPTSGFQFLSGKALGIFLTGLAQVGILVIGSSLLYQLRWGDWFGLLLLIISAAVAATGWGLLFAGLFQTPEQVSGVGTAVMLLFGAVSGTFVQLENRFVNLLGSMTPNQWALQGFNKLGLGQTTLDILPNLGALWLMAAVLFGVAAFFFRRSI